MRLRRPQHSKHRRSRARARRADNTVSVLPVSAGASSGPGSSDPVPAKLLAAARRPAYNARVVKVRVDGDELLCVIGDEGGSAAAWYTAVRQYAELAPTSLLVERHLPRGLWAVALRRSDNLLLCVSLLCTPSEQRAAARKLLRAARSFGWIPTPVPMPLVPLARASESAAAALSAHPIRTTLAAAGTVLAGSAGAFAALGILPFSAPSAPTAAPQTQLSQPQPQGNPVSHGGTSPKHRSVSAHPAVTPHSSTSVATRPRPAPSPSSSAAAPSRSPSPSTSERSPKPPASPSPSPSTSPSPRPSPTPSPSPSTSPSSTPSIKPPVKKSWPPQLRSPAATRCPSRSSGCGAQRPRGYAGSDQRRDARDLPHARLEVSGQGQIRPDYYNMQVIRRRS